jgi:hypothetical protein
VLYINIYMYFLPASAPGTTGTADHNPHPEE